MTNERAIQILENLISINGDIIIGDEDREALEMAIRSLQQEQQEVDLKEEIKEWANLMVGASFPEQDGDFISEEDYRSVIRQTALHFYELSKNSK